MFTRIATYVSTSESGATPSSFAIADVLAADDVGRVERSRRAQELHLLVAECLRVRRSRRLHRHERDELEQVVLDDVAQRTDLFVEAPARQHTEVLGERDLHVLM